MTVARRGAGKSTGSGLPRLEAAEFPALVAFFRGYLHQDVGDEHGGAVGAARAFRRDASSSAAATLAAEWAAFARAAAELPLREVRRVMAEEMGSAWVPLARRELAALGKALGGS